MEHQVFARKWRPQTFEAMVGQQHVIKALAHALDHNRLHHAYLFTGTRGVGKTTLARILAKSLNCEQGVSANPCRQCRSCLDIERGAFVDLIEVDAASRTKVEDTRELLDNVQYAPTKGRYKVYLIDEVHMLSNHSFNALLKTLEEPPEHVKFILATTDPQKLPATILSRCLQFHLKKLPPAEIEQHLQEILADESIACEPEALRQIAKVADGSLRDALSILDQAVSYGSGRLTAEETSEMLGTISANHVIRLLQALVAENTDDLFANIEAIDALGPDYEEVLAELLACLHQVTRVQVLGAKSGITTAELISIANTLSQEDVQLYYQIALTGQNDLPLAPTARSGFEMLLIRMLAFKPGGGLAQTEGHQVAPQELSANTTAPQPQASQSSPAVQPKQINEAKPQVKKASQSPREASGAAAEPAPAANHQMSWNQVVNGLKLTGIAKAVLQHTTLKSQNGNVLEIGVSDKQLPMFNERIIEQVQEALSQHYGKRIKLVTCTEEPTGTTLAQEKAEQKEQKYQNTVKSLENDQVVNKLLAEFDGKIDYQSVKITNPKGE